MACSLNKSSRLAPALGFTKFIVVTDKFLVTLVVLFKSDLDFQQTNTRDLFAEQSFCLGAALGVTTFTTARHDIGHTFIVLLKSEIDFQQTNTRLVC